MKLSRKGLKGKGKDEKLFENLKNPFKKIMIIRLVVLKVQRFHLAGEGGKNFRDIKKDPLNGERSKVFLLLSVFRKITR